MRQSVSVIVPTNGSSKTILETIESILKCEALEVLIVSRADVEIGSLTEEEKVRVCVAPDLNISKARNLGIARSSGSIVAFTDDDCAVREDWTASALKHFEDERVAVVGGPGLTHPNDPILAKCTGAVLTSSIGTSSSASRYRQARKHAATERELSACNLFFRRSTLYEVGYFHPDQQPCEENELIERIRTAGHKVIYDPSCIVYHHRRELFIPFLRQISFYAIGRAAYTMQNPNRFEFTIAGPSILLISTLLIPILYLLSTTWVLVLICLLGVYLVTVLAGALHSTVSNKLSLRYAPAVLLGIVLMHYCYGMSFLHGIFRSIWRIRD